MIPINCIYPYSSLFVNFLGNNYNIVELTNIIFAGAPSINYSAGKLRHSIRICSHNYAALALCHYIPPGNSLVIVRAPIRWMSHSEKAKGGLA